MKPMNEFIENVLQKTQKRKKNRGLFRSITAISVSVILVFLVAYSNIIPFGNVFKSNAYERYMQSYSTADGNTRLKILDGDNAVLAVKDRAYTCKLSETDARTFSLTPYSLPSEESLSVHFSGNQALLAGEWEDEEVRVTLNVVQDMQVESGAWMNFAVEQHEGGTFGASFDWFFIDETQSYCGTRDVVLTCKFVAVGDIVLQYVKDQVSGVCGALLFQRLQNSQYRFPVIATTSYENEDGSEYVTSYYKQLEEAEKIPFHGGKFQTNLIDYEYRSEKFAPTDYAQLAYLEGNVPWYVAPIGSVGQTSRKDITLSLDLKEDGTLFFRSSGNLFFNTSCGGRWYAYDDFVFVVLDKAYPFLSLRAFTFSVDEGYEEDFAKCAVSKIRSEGIYKVGYHSFDYYFSTAKATVYWGEETFNPKLVYNQEYVFKGWYTDWYYRDGALAERIYIEQAQPTKLVFYEDGTLEVYTGDTLWLKREYELKEYAPNKYSLHFDKFYIYNGETRYGVSRLNVGVNRVFMQSSENTTKDGRELIRQRMMEFWLVINE